MSVGGLERLWVYLFLVDLTNVSSLFIAADFGWLVEIISRFLVTSEHVE